MGKSDNAFDDLIASLDALPWLSVNTEIGKSGGRSWSLSVSRGDNNFIPFIGSQRIVNGYTLTLTTPGKNAPAELAENLKVINDTIIADRRRGGSAQTTIFTEEGWTVGEDEGREAFSISTSIEIHINEVK
jgi:hypothetical protein